MKKIKRNLAFVNLFFLSILMMSSGNYFAPTITIPLEYKPFLMEGGFVHYNSTVESVPYASFNCYIDNFPITNGVSVFNRYTVRFDNAVAKFEITDLQLSDEGSVKFEFKNPYGKTTTSTMLHVNPKPTY